MPTELQLERRNPPNLSHSACHADHGALAVALLQLPRPLLHPGAHDSVQRWKHAAMDMQHMLGWQAECSDALAAAVRERCSAACCRWLPPPALALAGGRMAAWRLQAALVASSKDAAPILSFLRRPACLPQRHNLHPLNDVGLLVFKGGYGALFAHASHVHCHQTAGWLCPLRCCVCYHGLAVCMGPMSARRLPCPVGRSKQGGTTD